VSRAFESRVESASLSSSSSIPARAILGRSQLLLEFFDLLMRLHLDTRHVIPWAFEMGDDLIELHVKGRGVPVLRVLEDEPISRVATLMAMLVLSTPKITNPITTSRAAMRTAQCEPIHFESQDASEANFFEICRLIWRPPVQLAEPVPRLDVGECRPIGVAVPGLGRAPLLLVLG
jgi:hypothetical protein